MDYRVSLFPETIIVVEPAHEVLKEQRCEVCNISIPVGEANWVVKMVSRKIRYTKLACVTCAEKAKPTSEYYRKHHAGIGERSAYWALAPLIAPIVLIVALIVLFPYDPVSCLTNPHGLVNSWICN